MKRLKKLLITTFILLAAFSDGLAQNTEDGDMLYVYTKSSDEAAMYQLDEVNKITFSNKGVQLWSTDWPTEYPYSSVQALSFKKRGYAYRLGDVNIDGIVDVSDVMMVVNHIIGNTLPQYHGENADMNSDGIVDVTDVVLIVEVILNPEKVSAPAISPRNGLTMTTKGDKTMLKMPFASDFSAFQMTVRLSEGMKLIEARLLDEKSHQMRSSLLPDGSWRIVVYSTDASPMRSAENDLLCLNTSGVGLLSLSEIVFSNMRCESVTFSDVTTTTGLDATVVDASSTGDIHDLSGRRHDTLPRQSGIYIKNGKAHSMKVKH